MWVTLGGWGTVLLGPELLADSVDKKKTVLLMAPGDE